MITAFLFFLSAIEPVNGANNKAGKTVHTALIAKEAALPVFWKIHIPSPKAERAEPNIEINCPNQIIINVFIVFSLRLIYSMFFI